MPTKIRQSARSHLYIKEWMDHLGITDDQLALRMETSRTTVWRWHREQWRLNPQKITAIADALGIRPENFYRPPSRPSIDAELDGASDDVIQAVHSLARNLTKKAS